jgi:hypothetical protein
VKAVADGLAELCRDNALLLAGPVAAGS